MSATPMNPAQREAVRYLDGPCLVIAGAGSGKTRVITQKVIRLVNAGINPENIGAITFTNKAAQEMAERLKPMLGAAKARGTPMICTFHSLGVRMLRGDGQRLGLKRGFSILDAEDAIGIVQQSLGTTDRKVARQAMSTISLWKNGLVDPDLAAATAPDQDAHAVARAYRDYAATLRAYQAVDFDDLIGMPVRLLQAYPEVATKWRETLRYLLVDEYQDTNVCQYELLKLLVGPRAAFTAVGDDDQSIYGWRGATLENLRRLGEEFPQLRVIKLEQNYRSCQSILNAANALIGSNPKLHAKTLFSELGPGDPINVTPSESEEAEAESVVMRLQAMKFERRLRFADFAILYRGNHQARVLEKALRAQKVPYVVSGGQSFFERAEIRDLISYLRLLANNDDDPALIRALTTPRRGIGTTTLAALGTYAGERHASMFTALFESGFEARCNPRQLAELRTFGEFINRLEWRAQREPAGLLLDELLVAIDYRGHLFGNHDEKAAAARWQNVTDFIDWLKKRAEQDGAGLIALAQTVALLTQLDRKEDGADAVQLSTIHAAKGLEYPHVYIVGCEEGILPHHGGVVARAESDQDVPGPASEPDLAATQRIEEERRLMYVAVTRAQRSLHLSWCRKRKRAREFLSPQPSRFIAEMMLDPRPDKAVTITGAAARGRLGALREMLASATDARDSGT